MANESSGVLVRLHQIFETIEFLILELTSVTLLGITAFRLIKAKLHK